MKKLKTILKPKKLVSYIIPIFIVLLLVGISVAKIRRDKMVALKTKTIPDIVQKIGGNSVKVKDVLDLKSESGIYSFNLKLEIDGKEQTFPSYITKDKKIFFTSGTKVKDLGASQTQQQTEQKKLTCADVNKTATPKLTAFVVSNCPFGLQMQRVINKAIGEQPALKQLVDVKYIGAVENGKITSMHGDEEAQENLRQICIREEQGDLYWPYVACYMKEQGKATACQNQVGVNSQTLNACISDSKRGLAYAQKDFDIANKLNIGRSPTLVSNGTQIVSEFDFGGRTADALKQVVCCASANQPSFCSTPLSTTDVATAYSLTDAAPSGAAAAANCGTN